MNKLCIFGYNPGGLPQNNLHSKSTKYLFVRKNTTTLVVRQKAALCFLLL